MRVGVTGKLCVKVNYRAGGGNATTPPGGLRPVPPFSAQAPDCARALGFLVAVCVLVGARDGAEGGEREGAAHMLYYPLPHVI